MVSSKNFNLGNILSAAVVAVQPIQIGLAPIAFNEFEPAIACLGRFSLNIHVGHIIKKNSINTKNRDLMCANCTCHVQFPAHGMYRKCTCHLQSTVTEGHSLPLRTTVTNSHCSNNLSARYLDRRDTPNCCRRLLDSATVLSLP